MNAIIVDQSPAKSTVEDRNDATQAAVVARVEKFVKETVRILGEVHIGSMDGNFEPLFHTVFHTMISKYTKETQ